MRSDTTIKLQGSQREEPPVKRHVIATRGLAHELCSILPNDLDSMA